MFEKKEQMIREQRTVEAMKHGYMGAEGKLAKIAKVFGDPIIRHGTSSVSQRYLDDPYQIYDPNAIPVMDEDDMSFEVGRHFDGLRRGHHLEIMWHSEFQEIKCNFQGRIVYLETGGTLDGYSPGEWETTVETLYERAKKQERINLKEEKKLNNESLERHRKEFLEAMKLKWGL